MLDSFEPTGYKPFQTRNVPGTQRSEESISGVACFIVWSRANLVLLIALILSMS